MKNDHSSFTTQTLDSRSRSRSRGRDRSRSRDRDDRKDSSQPEQKPTTPIPIDPASKLPPAIRGTMIAQSLLAKPEALPKVIESVAESAAALGLAPSAMSSDPLQSAGTSEPTKRVRKSRWSTTKSFVPGMPTILPSDLDEDQRQAYLLNLEIEEATRKLRIGDFSAPADPNERSPSPEPVYDSNGKRLNTREVRKRQELEQLRHEKIQALLRINPNYKPPADYRVPNIRFHDKVWIPQEDHPEINFVGLLIGPRGNTLRALEQETGAKIVIRGKGSVKEGKFGRRDGPLPGENEPLHAYVTSNDSQAIKRAVERIKEIVNAALLIPDGQNELRKLQLRELAILNGTMRPEDILGGTRCSNCGSDQHKSWECPEQQNVTASIVCTACGGAGHIARDCINPRPGFQYDGGAGMDEEYSALMAELGEKPAPGTYDPGVKTEPGVPKFSLQAQQKQQDRKFTLPSGAPIMRVNLANPSKNAQPLSQVGGAAPGGGDAASYAGWGYGGDMSAYYGYGDPSQMPPAAWGAPPPSGWSYPVPVPPPPPPPPVPAATSGATASSSDDWSNLLAPPAPPPLPS
ncbi:CBN-SFA-1 protein [Aphelenchoides avenae]|nr:CBN-SFA-1 protein [Aphelenchus avenae]